MFVSQLHDAWHQFKFMRPWRDDQANIRNGKTIIYAVDADIFANFGDPAEPASSFGRGRIGYGAVFKTDDKDLSAALARRVDDYIFYRLSSWPLLVVPPIETEITQIMQALASRFGEEPPTRPDDLSDLAEYVASLDQSGELDTEALYKGAVQLLYFQTGAAAKYRRLARLVIDSRLGGPDLERGLTAEQFDALRPFSTIKEIFEFLNLANEWSERMDGSNNRSGHPLAYRRDAEALARVEIWNQRLEPLNAKILYITGSRHIHTAAHSAARGAGGDRHFVRHPRYFMAFPDLWPMKSSTARHLGQASSFHGWLETLLVEVGATNIRTDSPLFEETKAFKELADKALADKPNAALEMSERWTHFATDIRAEYLPPAAVAKNLLEDFTKGKTQIAVKSSLDSWTTVRGQIDQYLDKEMEEAWEACFQLATRNSFALKLDEIGSDTSARDVVPIFFDSWERTRHFVQVLRHWRKREDVDLVAYEEGIREVSEEDSTGYGYYLIHAMLFASYGEWKIGAVLAERAISLVADRQVDAGNHANGREAHYLASYCRRLSSKSRADLDNLQSYIASAKDILKREKRSRPQLDVVSERFDAEALGIRVSQVLYDTYLPEPGLLADAGSEVQDDLLADLIALQGKVLTRLRQFKGTSEDRRQMERRDLLLVTLERISANIVSVSLARFREQAASVEPFRQSVDMLTRSGAFVDLPPTTPPSFVLRSLLTVAKAITDQSPMRLRDIEEHFRRAGKHTVFPYDTKRFEHYQEMAVAANRRLSGSAVRK